jgi:polyisoprenoid-binding protein YceI
MTTTLGALLVQAMKARHTLGLTTHWRKNALSFAFVEELMRALLFILLALPLPAEAGRYVGDDSSGSLKFDMEATAHKVPGTARSFTTEINLTESITGKVVVQSRGLTTGIGVRDIRMYDYCLAADKFPTIEFEVRGATGDTAGMLSEGGSGSINLHGTLKVRSTAREVVIPVTYTWTQEGLSLEGTKEIKWTDYGVPDPSIILSRLDPKIAISFDMNLHKSF